MNRSNASFRREFGAAKEPEPLCGGMERGPDRESADRDRLVMERLLRDVFQRGPAITGIQFMPSRAIVAKNSNDGGRA